MNQAAQECAWCEDNGRAQKPFAQFGLDTGGGPAPDKNPDTGTLVQG